MQSWESIPPREERLREEKGLAVKDVFVDGGKGKEPIPTTAKKHGFHYLFLFPRKDYSKNAVIYKRRTPERPESKTLVK